MFLIFQSVEESCKESVFLGNTVMERLGGGLTICKEMTEMCTS